MDVWQMYGYRFFGKYRPFRDFKYPNPGKCRGFVFLKIGLRSCFQLHPGTAPIVVSLVNQKTYH
jgi:hypothetical protein